jgi:hypothetical protein
MIPPASAFGIWDIERQHNQKNVGVVVTEVALGPLDFALDIVISDRIRRLALIYPRVCARERLQVTARVIILHHVIQIGGNAWSARGS